MPPVGSLRDTKDFSFLDLQHWELCVLCCSRGETTATPPTTPLACTVTCRRRTEPHCPASHRDPGLTDAVIGRLHRAAARTATCGPRTPASPAHTAAWASPTTPLLLTPAPLPAPWPVDTAREVHEAPSRPAPQPRSTDASIIDSGAVIRRPVCTATCGHRTTHRPASHRSPGLTDAAGRRHRAAACTVTCGHRTSHRPASHRSPDAGAPDFISPEFDPQRV